MWPTRDLLFFNSTRYQCSIVSVLHVKLHQGAQDARFQISQHIAHRMLSTADSTLRSAAFEEPGDAFGGMNSFSLAVRMLVPQSCERAFARLLPALDSLNGGAVTRTELCRLQLCICSQLQERKDASTRGCYTQVLRNLKGQRYNHCVKCVCCPAKPQGKPCTQADTSHF